MVDLWHLWLGALFLKREAYEYQRDRKDTFAHGLLFVTLVGLLTALAALAGALLRFAAGPNADAVKNVVLTHLQAMPFYTQSILPYPKVESQFLSGYNQTWDLLGSTFMGYPTNQGGWAALLAGVVVIPLILIVVWLVYGFLVHLVASRANPNTGLARGLGTLALAISPQAINLLGILPRSGLSVPVLGLWGIVLSVFAVRTAYGTSTGRSIWAVVFPLLLLLLLTAVVLAIWLSLFVGKGGTP
ncbi:MAG: YIP1 family protein [Rudaea sp.]